MQLTTPQRKRLAEPLGQLRGQTRKVYASPPLRLIEVLPHAGCHTNAHHGGARHCTVSARVGFIHSRRPPPVSVYCRWSTRTRPHKQATAPRGAGAQGGVFPHRADAASRHCRGPLVCDGGLPHWVAGVVRSLYPNVQPGRRMAAAVPVVAVSFRRGGPGDRHGPGHWVPLRHSLVDGHAGAVIPLLRIERTFGFLCGRRDLPRGRRHAPGEGREDSHLWSCLAVGGLPHPIPGQVPPRQPHNGKCLCPVQTACGHGVVSGGGPQSHVGYRLASLPGVLQYFLPTQPRRRPRTG